MNKKFKLLATVLSAVLLVAVTVIGTVAYLTDRDTAVNTFTVGKVDIKLDETDVTPDGKPVENAERVQENDYHLIPGGEYVKDPMVTVLENSEPSYVRMLVTVDHKSEFDAIFAPGGASLTDIFAGYSTDWSYFGETVDADTVTYEFRYKDIVAATGDSELELAPLFEKIVVPGELTGEQLASVAGFKITVNAHAIQAEGFADEAAAWAAFADQISQ